MTVLLVVVLVALAIACVVQRNRIRGLRDEVASERRWAENSLWLRSEAINELDAATRHNRRQADQIVDLEEQLQGAQDEIERLSRAIG